MISIALLLLFSVAVVLLVPLWLARKQGTPFFARANSPLITAAICVPVTALVLYALLGSMPAYLKDQQLRLTIQEQGADAVLRQNILRLEEQLARRPAQKEIRADLVKVYLFLGQLDKAQELVSHPIMQEDEEHLALALRVHYAQSGWSEQVEDLSARLAILNNNHPILLSVKAMKSYQEKDYENAISLWRRLLTLDLSMQEERRIQELIRQAQQSL